MATSDSVGDAAASTGIFVNSAEVEDVEGKPDMECIYITDDKIKYINNNYKKVNAKMYDYQSDVKLKVDDSYFKGHRKVLSEASDYFAAMFSHEMKEKGEQEIELKDISPSGFSAMLDYFYHGHVTVEGRIVPHILEAARFFHVDWILDVCCDYMTRHLSLTDYSLTMELADTYSLGDLRWEIFKYFGNNLPALVEKENFLKTLSAELLLQYLMEFLYTDVSEYFLVQVIIGWVSADPDNHKEHLLPLLRQIRFHTMDLEELEELPDIVLEQPEIRNEIEDAKMYCLNISAQCLRTGSKYLARGSEPCVVISNFNDETESNVVVYKDPEDDDANLFIEQLGPSGLNSDYSTMSQTALGNFLFAAGGYDKEFKSSEQVYRYDPRFREWTQIASMSTPRVSFAICSSDNRLYVLGGVQHTAGDTDTTEIILASVEVYNPEENSWSYLPEMPYGAFDQAAATWQNTVYICGGISSLPSHPIPLKSMKCLTPGSEQWTELDPLLTGRQGHSLTAYQGKLYALGGYTSKPGTSGFRDCVDNDVFDIETKQWTALTATREEFGHLYRTVGLINKKIYFLCCNDENVYLSSYNIETNEFDLGVLVGSGVQKVGILQVAYPRHS